MKNLFLAIILFVLFFSAEAQNTWVQKLSYEIQMQGYFDTLVGPVQIDYGPDHSLFVLANIDAHGSQQIFKFYPNSHNLAWTVDAGYLFADGNQWTERFKATSDSGIILCYNWQYFTDPCYGTVIKYAKDGTLQWSTAFHIWDWNSGTDRDVYDVVEKTPGIFDVLVRDSMYTLDNTGNLIDSTAAISGTRLMQMTNGDLLVYSGSTQLLSRKDVMGNTQWSEVCTGHFAYDSSSVFIVNTSSVKKVDAVTGSQIWNKNYGHSFISDIEADYAGGFVASVGDKPRGQDNWGNGIPMTGYLIGADSLGDTLWIRNYPLPHFGLSALKLMPSGNLATGGCYLSGQNPYPYKDFSAFICMMNNDGSYPLAQTDYISPGDANHDHFSYWNDDALATMLAIGQTGMPRDTSPDEITFYDGSMVCDRSDIAIDWPASSPAGVNYKYADYDGNGIIDTTDVVDFDNCSWNFPDSIPLYYRMANQDASQNVNEFCLIPVRDTIQPGEDATFYMIMGNGGNSVDSIYGFAFSTYTSEYGSDYLDSITFYHTGLGIPGSDLFCHRSYAHVTNAALIRNPIMMCRTDFQNATNVQDTLGLISFGGFFQQSPIVPTIAGFKAVLVSGTEILFSICAGGIYIDSSSVSVNEKQHDELKIFPNPASDFLFVKNIGEGNKKISVLNSLGMIVTEFESPEKQLQIPVNDLTNGIYSISIQTDHSITKKLFVIQH